MKRLLLLALLFFSFNVFSQNIQGTVYDENKNPMYGATVYLEGTTINTTTDDNGKFSLTVNGKINTYLVITFLGYQSIVISNPFENKENQFYLIPKTNVLSEVKVESQLFTRAEKLKLFKEQFLGLTKAGKSCVIENEEDINFDYDLKKASLFVTANNPIKIRNNYLKYYIVFDLHEFQVKFNRKSMESDDVSKSYFAGTAIYKDESSSETEINQLRDKVYFGSRNHFFKNLIHNKWGKDDFLFFRGKFQDNPNDYFSVSKENNLFKVDLTDSAIEIKLKTGQVEYYASYNLLFKKKQQSKIVFQTNTLYVDEFGNTSHIDQIEFGGKMGEYRVGDMLPINYLPALN